ncbi:MAG TPA: SWIM zinc finger family protein [Candidatus Sulfopaludibacter sp.]|jgi:uncharacterized Zn finger protein|nr:SWIM zinc finger family protein [Candidatus Sulfopaludibacter sp.]
MAYYDDWGGFAPYVSVAERRRMAALEVEQREKEGQRLTPIVIAGSRITTTFWGKAWCQNLESYSDFANRLPRGRSYVRNGSVIHLEIGAGSVEALVMGSELYEVSITVTPVAAARWKSICRDCAGGIDSLVELLQGRFSKGVMERICLQGKGLFPTPREIRLHCSCPDGARMCKHVAAVLYGVGARLDKEPELLFQLHKVDAAELIASAGKALPLSKRSPDKSKILGGDLAGIFGLELSTFEETAAPPTPKGDSLPASPRKRQPRKPRPPSRAPNRNSRPD